MSTQISNKSILISVSMPIGITNDIENHCSKTNQSLSSFIRESVIRRLDEISLVSQMFRNGPDNIRLVERSSDGCGWYTKTFEIINKTPHSS